MAEQEQFTVKLTSSPNECITAVLRDKHELASDKPEWLPEALAGNDDHPAPVDFLVIRLASYQTSVLRQCLEKNGIEGYISSATRRSMNTTTTTTGKKCRNTLHYASDISP